MSGKQDPLNATPRTDHIDESGSIKRAKAPASGVSIPRHLGVGSDLVHALDYVVQLQVMFNLASGPDSTPMLVWRQLQERGIRSAKDAKTLVGKNAVYDSFNRLIEAGYMSRKEEPNLQKPGRKGRTVYEVYDNPAWNPDWQKPAESTDHEEVKPQVGTLPGTPDPAFGETGKTAGRNASRNAGTGNAGTGVPEGIDRRIPAGRNASLVPGNVEPSPPHPPGEEEPPPPTPTHSTESLPSQRKEAEGSRFSEEQLKEARGFLGRLPYPWTVGRQAAYKLATPLLEAATEQGWLLDDALAAELTKNADGVRNHTRTLERVRIPDLIRRDMLPATRSAGAPVPGSGDGANRATQAQVEALRAKIMRGAQL